jgi:hypothetical protein
MKPNVAAPARNSTVPNPISPTVVPAFPLFGLPASAAELAVSDGLPGTAVVGGSVASVVPGDVAEGGSLLGWLAWRSMTWYVARADASLATVMVWVLVPRYVPGGGVACSAATQPLPVRAGAA